MYIYHPRGCKHEMGIKSNNHPRGYYNICHNNIYNNNINLYHGFLHLPVCRVVIVFLLPVALV